MGLSVYSVLSTLETWVTGYNSEHLQLGLQQGISQALALLPVLVNQFFLAVDRGGSALFIAVTVAVVLEPSTGDAFSKLVLRLLGAGVAGGIGLLNLFIAVGYNTYSYDEYHKVLSAWVVPGVAICSFVFATNHQRYWRHREFWSVALLTLPIVVVPAVRSPGDIFYSGACYRMMDVVLGIVLAAAVSYFVFPVRARKLLEKKMASTLNRLGDLAVWIVGQACVPPATGTGSMPGKSGTDDQCLYTDDGLRARLAPLLQTTNRLADDISGMWRLLEAANAELSMMPPYRFPTEQYRNLLHSCHISMGILYSLINIMQSGEFRLDICQRHIGNLSEAGVRLSASFTALSSLIRPPKTKRKRKWGRKKKKNGAAAGAAAAEGRDPGVGTGGAANDLAAPQLQRRAKGGPMQQQSSLAAPLVDDLETAAADRADGCADNPFAELEQEASAQGTVPAPVVGLSDSQLLSAQQMARHLSLVMARHPPRGANGSDGGHQQGSHGIDDGIQGHGNPAGGSDAGASFKLQALPGSNLERPSPFSSAAGGSNDMSAAAAAEAAKPGIVSGGGSLRDAGSGSIERREWVLAKLQALVDSIQPLEVAILKERQAPTAAGLHSFMLLVHALINLTRQCGACFTALDAQRGAVLHQHFQWAREEIRRHRH